MIDNCLHCGGAIWLDDFEGRPTWTHVDTGRATCPPLSQAAPSTVRIG